jgi:hypothetical protein
MAHLSSDTAELKLIRENFLKLTEINLKQVDPEYQEMRRELRNRIVTQLLLDLQTVVRKIFLLNSQVFKNASFWQGLSTSLNISSLIIMFGIILVNSYS